ncbi:hypothetical protein SROCM77S_05143 [Streptomyces rochei]
MIRIGKELRPRADLRGDGCDGLIRSWCQRVGLGRPSTAKAVAQHLRCYVYPAWEKRALGAIKPGDVQSWVTSLTTTHGLAASTSRTVFNTVNAVFRAAVRDRMIPHNPCAEAKLP